MGEHDHPALTGRHTRGDDTHQDIHDDGRTLGCAEFEPGAGGGAEDFAYNDTPVFRYSHDKLIPDTVHVHLRPFSVTKWESMFSTLFGSGTHPDNWVCPSCDPGLEPTFRPVIDDSYRVVGHLGWISGTEICLPKNSVAWDSRVAHILEERRLGEDRRRLLAMHDRDPFPPFPGRRWAPEPDTKFWAAVRRGPLKDASEEQRHQNNINYFLAGGGTAVVGRDYVHDQMASQNFDPFLPGDYRCMALVRPDGCLQSVLMVEKILHESRQARGLRIIFEVIDIALTVWMIIDIATISVGLLRLGVMLASRVEIRAIQLAVDQGAKAALDLAKLEARRAVPVVLGAMAGPRAAAKDAFWLAARATPRQFSKAEADMWTARIARRMKELGIPERNIGIKVRKYPPGKPKKMIGTSSIPGESGEAFNPAGIERGSNLRTVADQYGVEEGGISVHGSVFNRWEGFDLWNNALVEDRIDAIIAHEWMEFNELSHWETVELIEQSKLRISEKAKELLKFMRTQGKPVTALTEFPK